MSHSQEMPTTVELTFAKHLLLMGRILKEGAISTPCSSNWDSLGLTALQPKPTASQNPDSLPKRTSHHPPEETQPSLPAMLATDRFSSGRVDRAASLSETDEQRRTHGMHPSASDLLADLNKRQSAAAASTDGFLPAPTTPPMTKVLHTLHAM